MQAEMMRQVDIRQVGTHQLVFTIGRRQQYSVAYLLSLGVGPLARRCDSKVFPAHIHPEWHQKCLAFTRSKFMGYWISCPFDQNRGPTICPKWDNSQPKTEGDPNNGLKAKRRARLPIETNGVRLENGFGLRLPEVEQGNDVEQDHAEGDEARKDAEPGGYERALVLAGRRRGDSKHEVESPEYFCEKLDHGAPAEMRSDGGSSVRHRSDFFFDFRDIDHDDGIPRTAIEEAAVGALAEAFLAADAQNRVNLDAPKRWTVFVRHPKHAVLDGAVFHAGRRSRAPGAAFGDDSEFFR